MLGTIMNANYTVNIFKFVIFFFDIKIPKSPVFYTLF